MRLHGLENYSMWVNVLALLAPHYYAFLLAKDAVEREVRRGLNEGDP